LNGDFDVSAEVTSTIFDLQIKTDGTKLYILANGSSTATTIFQYTLTIPWDITSLVYDNKTIDISTLVVGAKATGFRIGDDGNKFYFSNENDSWVIEQSTLSTPWDISTAVYDSITSAYVDPTYSFSFKADGTMLFVAYTQGNRLVSYELSTPWDISTNGGAINGASIKTASTGARVEPNGEHSLCINNPGADTVDSYSMEPSWDVSTMAIVSTLTMSERGAVALDVGEDGRYFYVGGGTTSKVYRYRAGQ